MQFLLRRLPDDGRVMFPGSQPVSLARAKLHMLRDRRDSYMVSAAGGVLRRPQQFLQCA